MNLNPIYMDESRAVSTDAIQEFKTKHLDLNLAIQSALQQGNRSPIGDGVFHYEGYLKANVKILWLMKEPYDTVKGDKVEEIKTGGWYFSGSDMYTKRTFGRDRTTWYPIINASHAILSGQSIWKHQRISKHKKEIADVLSHIAYVNIQKLASLTREKTNNTVIQEAFLRNISWVQKQIDLLNPDVIIGANTLNDHVFSYFGLKGKNLPAVENSYLVNGKLFIRTNHPSQRHRKADAYINHMLTSVSEWQKIRAQPSPF